MLPGHDPAVCDGLEQDLPGFRSPEVEGLSSVATVWEDAIDSLRFIQTSVPSTPKREWRILGVGEQRSRKVA
jgi:hypothetical protein